MEKGIDKSTERAFEAYPPKYAKQERHPKKIQSEKVDTHQPMRAIYIKGYHQAEKDLKLTWEDIEKIVKIHTDIYLDFFIHDNGCKVDTKEYYQEVLKRFEEKKKDET